MCPEPCCRGLVPMEDLCELTEHDMVAFAFQLQEDVDIDDAGSPRPPAPSASTWQLPSLTWPRPSKPLITTFSGTRPCGTGSQGE